MRALITSILGVCVASSTLLANEAASASPSPRPLWTSSKVVGRADPPLPFRVEPTYPKLSIHQPLGIFPEPGTNNLLALQHLDTSVKGPGRILRFDDDVSVDRFDCVLQLYPEEIPYWIVFHPEHEQNGYIYMTSGYHPGHSMVTSGVSRFTVSRDPPYGIDPASRVHVIEWSSEKGGHIGGGIAWGPRDGYLYVGAGDGTSGRDELKQGQDLSDILGTVIRIDVLRPDGNRPYSIPTDNPFVNTQGARPEIWAYGLRQPWRMNAHPETGQIWCAQNGEDQWEQVLVIEKGANYGWSVMEGAHPHNLSSPRGPTPFSPPVYDHPHSEARSLTGGVVYFGKAYPELRGAYIYGDWATGRIWAIRYDGDRITYHREIADTSLEISALGVDHDGEVIVLGHERGKFYRLVRTNEQDSKADFPRTLSATGLFTSVEDHELHPGLIPFQVNVPQFSGGARAERAIGLPGDMKMSFHGERSFGMGDGAVLIKTLAMATTRSDSSGWQRIETQMLHRHEGEWYGYSYRWNDEGTDATLVESAGAEVKLRIRDPDAPEGHRQQTWRFSARAECMMCHSRASAYRLGATGPQLHRKVERDGRLVSQIEYFGELGLFASSGAPNNPKAPVKEQLDSILTLVDPYDPSHDIDLRARSYLHATCAHCHQAAGGGNSRVSLHLKPRKGEAHLINALATQSTFDFPDAKIVNPGDPDSSVLVYRLATMGGARMPKMGSTEIDTRALSLIREWIGQMPQTAEDPRRQGERRFIQQLVESESANDSVRELVSMLLESTSAAVALADMVAADRLAPTVRDVVIERATGHDRTTTRDFFDRFLPEEQRRKRLGNQIPTTAILAMNGDAERGRALFEAGTTAQCRSCHRHGEGEPRMGPDLTEIGKKLQDYELLESILEPSQKIEPEYVGHIVITNTGDTYTGCITRPSEDEIIVRTASQEEVRLHRDDVIQLLPQDVSLMPTGLVSEMTAQELADLLAFLESSK